MPRLSSRSRSGSAKRVLVVDDDPAIIDLVCMRLDLAGYHSFVARGGNQALDMLPDVRPDAMVLDLNMPGLDGFGVLRKMPCTAVGARTATMVLTARNQPADVKLALSLGALDYLAKPFGDELLLRRVERLLRQGPPGALGRPLRQVYL